MQTQKIILTAVEDQESGGIGLTLPGMEAKEGINPAQEGVLLAHDLIEHVNSVDDIGTIDDELEALGAIWFVRGQFNDIRRDGPSYRGVHENIAADVTRMFRDFFYGADVDLTIPSEGTEETDEDGDFEAILRYAAKDYQDEIDAEEAAEEEVQALFEKYQRVCLPRMRIGYAKAAAKYNDDGIAANALFWAIVNATDKIVKHCEFEGQQWELTYGFDNEGNAIAFCDEYYPDDDFSEDEED